MTPPEELMKTVMEAWGQGDLGPLRAALHDDVIWMAAATEWNDLLRSGGTHRGRASVIALFSKLATGFVIDHCTAREVISSGEIVWGLFEIVGKHFGEPHPSEKMLATQTAVRWRVRNGKIIEHQSFYDTLGLLNQLNPTVN